MSEDNSVHEAPTRRDYMKYSGVVIGGGLLAGCAGQPDSGSTPGSTSTETATATDTETTTEDASYTVNIQPTGDITFKQPPELAIPYSSNYGDMVVALGQGDALARIGSSYPAYPYEDLDIDFSTDTVQKFDGSLTKEVAYEIDPDVIHIDPVVLVQWFGWDEADIEEVSKNVAPFAANYIRRKGDDWHDYPYYTLYEAFDKIATVYQEQERYEAFKQLHDETISGIQSRLPEEGNRPSVALLTLGSDTKKGDLVGLTIADELGRKHYNDLKVNDALAELDAEGAFYNMDYEGLLEVNPKTIIVPWARNKAENFEETFVQPMKDDPVGSEVAAVKNDRVFPGGTANQGPIVNLANTEFAAHRLYPEEFGGEELYDRGRVEDIVNGNL